MRVLSIITFIFIGLLSGSSLWGQSKTQLQNKKNKLLKEIQYTNSLIKQNKEDQDISIKQIQKILANIELRAELLKTYEEELKLLEMEIIQFQIEVSRLENQLEQLKKGYQNMVYQAWKNRSTLSKWMYILSAKNFNQAIRRLRYYKQIKEIRVLQASSIEKSKSDLTKQLDQLKVSRADKERAKLEKASELKSLESEKEQKDELLKNLKKKEKELLDKVKKQKKERNELTKKINAIINSIKKENKSNKNNKTKNNTNISNTSGNSNSSGFSSNKGKLSWPVERGTVTGKFGIHKHPVLKNVDVKNDGIDISTDKGAAVRAVYKGTVSGVFKVDGYENVIIIRHGSYLTVYSHLSSVAVNKGDEVKTEQNIGKAATNDEGETYINFQVRYGSSVQNPTSWLVK